MEILVIVIVVIVSLAVILPGYLIKKSKSDKGNRLISAIAGVILLALVWLFPPDPPGDRYARIGLTVMAIIPIVFWLIDVLSKTKAKD